MAIYRPVQFEAPELITEVPADASGGFDVEFVPEELGNCNPGSSFAFVAGPAGTTPYTPGQWPVAIYDVEQLGEFSLMPSAIPCGSGPQAVQPRGSGFPASAEVTVLLGGAGPLADNFASLGEFMADASGVLEAEITLLVAPCDAESLPSQAAVFGFVEGLAARWKALYDIVP